MECASMHWTDGSVPPLKGCGLRLGEEYRLHTYFLEMPIQNVLHEEREIRIFRVVAKEQNDLVLQLPLQIGDDLVAILFLLAQPYIVSFQHYNLVDIRHHSTEIDYCRF